MKFLHLSFAYPPYIADLYSRKPGLAVRSFEDQSRILNEDFFAGASDSLAAGLRSIGYEARDHAVLVEPLQRAWASAHDLPVGDDWALEIAAAQVAAFDPDVIMLNPFFLPRRWIERLRATTPGLRLVMARHSSPRKDLSPFQVCDVVVSGDTQQVDDLRAAGIDGQHLHHGFDDRVLPFLGEREDPVRAVLFTGQLLRRPGFHMYRTDVVRAIADAGIPLDLRLLSDPGVKARMRRALGRRRWDLVRALQKVGVPGERISSVPGFTTVLDQGPPARELDRSLTKAGRPPVFGLEMFRAMRGTAVTLNVHGDVSVSEANNLRLWEATGVGTCLLTDDKSNLGELFEVGKEVVAFDSVPDAVEKARWLLDNPDAAESIARAGQQRTLRDHTYARRAVQLDGIIRSALGEKADL